MVQAGRRPTSCETCTSAEPCENRLKPAENGVGSAAGVIETCHERDTAGKFYLLSTRPFG